MKLEIEKDNISGVTSLKSYEVQPTYVNRYRANGRLNYDVVKLQDIIPGGKLSGGIDSNLQNAADKKYKEAIGVLQGEI